MQFSWTFGISYQDKPNCSCRLLSIFICSQRTIRVVFDPGTENEKTAEAALPVNTWFNVFYNGTFAKEVYTDRECTQPLTDDEIKEDLVVHVRSE